MNQDENKYNNIRTLDNNNNQDYYMGNTTTSQNWSKATPPKMNDITKEGMIRIRYIVQIMLLIVTCKGY